MKLRNENQHNQCRQRQAELSGNGFTEKVRPLRLWPNNNFNFMSFFLPKNWHVTYVSGKGKKIF
jgi:hypothetical protein